MPFIDPLNRFISLQDRFQKQLGHLVAWTTLILVVLVATIVVLRYGFDFGSTQLQESALYIHAVLFMLGIAYTYQQDQHVRVDVFYGRADATQKAWIDLLGTLFLVIPSMLYIVWIGWDYVAASWAIQERSAEAGGLAYLYLLKTLILIMAALVLLQALANAARAGLQIAAPQSSPPPPASETEGRL
jgi:TRAP-type mannitol/chloroaromatic compound transport system permease small subunit